MTASLAKRTGEGQIKSFISGALDMMYAQVRFRVTNMRPKITYGFQGDP